MNHSEESKFGHEKLPLTTAKNQKNAWRRSGRMASSWLHLGLGRGEGLKICHPSFWGHFLWDVFGHDFWDVTFKSSDFHICITPFSYIIDWCIYIYVYTDIICIYLDIAGYTFIMGNDDDDLTTHWSLEYFMFRAKWQIYGHLPSNNSSQVTRDPTATAPKGWCFQRQPVHQSILARDDSPGYGDSSSSCGYPKKWLVYSGTSDLEMDDLGVPVF